MEAIPWSAPLSRQFERGEKIVVVGRSELVSENFLAKHYISVMIALPRLITAASLKWMKWMAAARWSGLRLLLYLGPDLRRHSAGRTTKSAAEFFAVLGSSKIKQPDRNFHRKISDR